MFSAKILWLIVELSCWLVALEAFMLARHLLLVRRFWTAAIAAEMEYRLNFWLETVTSIGNFAGSLFGLYLFYRQGYQFAGWSWEAALVVVGVFTFFQGVSAAFLSPNLSKIVEQIQKGTLDFVLLKPISSQFWLSTRSISPWGLPDIFLGIGLIIYGGIKSQVAPINYLLGIVPLVSAFFILYSLWFMLGATSIWFVKIYNVTEVLRGLLEAGRYPLVAYPPVYRFFFTFVVPVSFITTVPAEVFLGRVSWGNVGGSIGLAILLMFLANRWWQFALRFYTSASS
jgi:ABC-2 type transport system permease protein